MALVAGMSSPPLSQPGDRAGLLFQAVGFSPSGLAMAPGSGPGFTSSSERGALSWGPGHPVVARGSPRRVNPAVAWPKASGSRIRNVWPARPRRTTSRHRSSLTSLRAFHRVTSGVDVCAGHLGPEPTDPGGFAFTIETGSDFPIGPTGHQFASVSAFLPLLPLDFFSPSPRTSALARSRSKSTVRLSPTPKSRAARVA